MEITIPHNFSPRPYQLPFLKAMDSGCRRACLVWHRRAGKDLTVLNYTVKAMMQRVGSYYHCFPEYAQGRKALWDGADKTGKRHLSCFPDQIIKSRNATEMKIETINGSIWQIVGADNYDKVVGAGPVGLVLSEWAVSDRYPMAWDFFSPMLAENGGWAIFPYTPRGRNHGWDRFQMARTNPDWFCSLLTIEDTGAYPISEIEKERADGKSEDMIQQEYYCSFLADVENVLIPSEWLDNALKRTIGGYSTAPRIAGLDVARFGDDRTVFIVRQGHKINHIEVWSQQDTAQTTFKALDLHKRGHYDVIAVDAIGIGAGVADHIKAAGVPCLDINVSELAADDDLFNRQRDELWWKVREWFGTQQVGFAGSVSSNLRAALVKDMGDIRFVFTPIGKRQIETKADMKKRLGFSPDMGDALCLTFGPVEYVYRDTRRQDLEQRQREDEYNPLRAGLGRQQ